MPSGRVASYQDGTYHAEFDRKDPRNWIPYVDVTIKDGTSLARKLTDTQDISKVDAVSGATHSSRNFTKLVPAALEKAAAGDTTPAKIPLYTDGTYKVSAGHFPGRHGDGGYHLIAKLYDARRVRA